MYLTCVTIVTFLYNTHGDKPLPQVSSRRLSFTARVNSSRLMQLPPTRQLTHTDIGHLGNPKYVNVKWNLAPPIASVLTDCLPPASPSAHTCWGNVFSQHTDFTCGPIHHWCASATHYLWLQVPYPVPVGWRWGAQVSHTQLELTPQFDGGGGMSNNKMCITI